MKGKVLLSGFPRRWLFVWDSVCRHVKREAGRFIISRHLDLGWVYRHD